MLSISSSVHKLITIEVISTWSSVLIGHKFSIYLHINSLNVFSQKHTAAIQFQLSQKRYHKSECTYCMWHKLNPENSYYKENFYTCPHPRFLEDPSGYSAPKGEESSSNLKSFGNLLWKLMRAGFNLNCVSAPYCKIPFSSCISNERTEYQ